MFCGIAFCTLCIFIGYRTVELANELAGPVISTTEGYFDWLDGDVVTLATHTLDLFHPGVLVKKDDPMAHALQQAIDEANSIQM
ncbi:hypothetical protein C8R48DRAFT_728225 [Suillus tomentosus]|nr:hypothetical protein C8R48DRAFT_728225 [Suillus tomentosus]